MKLFLLTALTMIAFAANSVINRAALADGDIGPASFALIRLATGALLLVIILRMQGAFQSNIASVSASNSCVIISRKRRKRTPLSCDLHYIGLMPF